MKTISLQEKYNRERFEMLLEVIDENEIREIGQTFSEIDRIIGDANIPSVKNITQQARGEITKLQSRGFFKQIIGSIGLNLGQKRTMSSIVSLQTQLISMLRALPDIISIAGPIINKKLSQTPRQQANPLASVKRGERPETQGESLESALMAAGPEGGNAALKNLRALMEKALQPPAIQGLFSNFKLNPSAITKDILQLPMDDFRELAKRAAGAKLQVPIEKEDVQQLQGAEEQTDAGAAISKLTPKQAELYMQVFNFLEKIGQKIEPEIKKAIASRLRAGK